MNEVQGANGGTAARVATGAALLGLEGVPASNSPEWYDARMAGCIDAHLAYGACRTFDQLAEHIALGSKARAHLARVLRRLSALGEFQRDYERRWSSVRHEREVKARWRAEQAQKDQELADLLDNNLGKLQHMLLERDSFREWLLHVVRDVLGRDLSAAETLRFAGILHRNRGAVQ